MKEGERAKERETQRERESMREKERETQREERERERYVKCRLEFNVSIPEADYLPFSGHN